MSDSDKAGERACDRELVSMKEKKSKRREGEREDVCVFGGVDTVPGTII